MENTIRVLQIGMYNNLGGIETFLYNYYRKIDKEKVQFDFINMYDKICFQEELINLGAKIHNVTNVKINPIKCKNEIVRLIKANKYEIVHINMLSAANVIPLIAAKKAGVKVIIAHSHNANTPKNIIKKFLHKVNKRIILSSATHYFACSEKAGKWLFGESNSNRVTVVNNAVEVEKFTFNKELRRAYRELEQLDNKFVIGHVGRFSEQKNHDFLIDIFKSIYDRNNNSVLLLIGIGELEDTIRKKVKKLGLEENVKFLGLREDVNKLYNVMDVFLLPSLFEGLPIVGVEAQISGLKCIFSDTITPEVKLTDNCKFISLDDSVEKWADIVLEAVGNYSRNNINKVLEKSCYDINAQARAIEKFYLDACK